MAVAVRVLYPMILAIPVNRLCFKGDMLSIDPVGAASWELLGPLRIEATVFVKLALELELPIMPG